MARKTKGLPFVVQPRLKPITERLGSEESGMIEIERKGYLTVSEKAIVQQSMADATGMTEVFMIAKEIGSKTGKTPSEIFDDIAEEDLPEYLIPYRSEITEMMTKMISHEERLRLVAATALIITRVAPDWDPTDTIGLHPDLQEALYKLYSDEEKKSIEALEDAAKEVDKGQEGAEGKA